MIGTGKGLGMRLIAAGVGFWLVLFAASAAPAITLCAGSCPAQGGSDFVLALDLEPGVDLDLNTSGNVYFAAPNGLVADTLTLSAFEIVIEAGATVVVDVLTFCAGPLCDLDFTETGDVYLQALGGLGDIVIQAGQTIVVSPNLRSFVPEPATCLLLGLGLAGLAVCRRADGRISSRPG